MRIPRLAALLFWLCGCGAAPDPTPRPDVLLITLDTLRADHLGAYGAPPGATPALDALAADGAVFERMLAASSRTAPSHASIFTSRWVRDHAIGYRNGATRLDDDETTLAERLAEAGYATAAFVSNAMLRRRVGLDAGFAHYDDTLPDTEANRPVFERVADKTTERAIEWLGRPRDRPRFVWVHYNDPHGPYTPPHAFVPPAGRGPQTALPALEQQRGVGGIPAYQVVGDERDPRQYQARYAGEVRYLDAAVGRLLDAFAATAGEARAVVAVTADHGESFGEDGIWFSHGFGTTPDLAHVPFLLVADGIPATRVRDAVHHVDVMPTLLERVGLPVPGDAAGRALGPVARGEATLPEDRPLYVDVGAEVSVYRGERFVRARLSGDLPGALEGSRAGYRWVGPSRWDAGPPDPGLAKLAERHAADRAPLRFAESPDASQQERLRALGYLEPGSDAPSEDAR